MKAPLLLRRSFLALGGLTLVRWLGNGSWAEAAPVQTSKRQVRGVSCHFSVVDLTDPQTFISIGLANNSDRANTQQMLKGRDEPFEQMVTRYRATIVANGTFFSKNASKSVMGNMVGGGRFLKYSQWENFGTTLGLRVGNRPEMITARTDGQPEWRQHWFSLTCGPRLLREGKIWLNPEIEGFKDPNVLGVGARTAIGYPQNGQRLFLVNFDAPLSLKQEAEAMQQLGCYEAMNLDGGASSALAVNQKIVVPAGRNLTNVILVYDAKNPAPKELQEAWKRFQQGERPVPF